MTVYSKETAIHQWVIACSGLTENFVIWAQQSSPRPNAQFITMNLASVQVIGQDWTKHQDADPVVESEEVELITSGVREVRLSLQCFGGIPTGANSPRARLERIIDNSSTPGRRQDLKNAGIGLLRFSPVQSLSGLVNATLEPRAALDVFLSISHEIIETATYIETAEITGTVDEEEMTSFIVDISE